MKRILLLSVTLLMVGGCYHAEWETIAGKGISDEPQSIDNVIYFEDERRGVVGGFTLMRDPTAPNDAGLLPMPTLYRTEDGGKNWQKVHFDPSLRQGLQNACLRGDTLVAQTNSFLLLSANKGRSFRVVTDTAERLRLVRHYLTDIRSIKKPGVLRFEGQKYTISERYQNHLAFVLVCHGQEAMTHYYFVSFDQGASWTFLQKDFADNRRRFLLEDKFLLCYQFPFGLQRLPLNRPSAKNVAAE